jgi:hypothetical protein
LKEVWTISRTENIKGDKIKALALAKDCYAMKLELLTNATVVDDAIRFVASNAVKATKKGNTDKIITEDKEFNNSNNVQGSQDSHGLQQRQPITTNNSIF